MKFREEQENHKLEHRALKLRLERLGECADSMVVLAWNKIRNNRKTADELGLELGTVMDVMCDQNRNPKSPWELSSDSGLLAFMVRNRRRDR